jgi:hypothetical protein
MRNFIDVAILEQLKEEIVEGINSHEEQSNSRGNNIPRVWRASSPEHSKREVHKKQAEIMRNMLGPLQQLIVLNKEAVKNFQSRL